MGWWKVLETDISDGWTTLGTYLMPLNCTIKNSWNGTFYVIVCFSSIKKRETDVISPPIPNCCKHRSHTDQRLEWALHAIFSAFPMLSSEWLFLSWLGNEEYVKKIISVWKVGSKI